MSKIYILTEQQMQKVTDMACALTKELKSPYSTSVSFLINELAKAQVVKSDDRLNGALGTFINALQDKNNNN